jgi:hypothetical protein
MVSSRSGIGKRTTTDRLKVHSLLIEESNISNNSPLLSLLLVSFMFARFLVYLGKSHLFHVVELSAIACLFLYLMNLSRIHKAFQVTFFVTFFVFLLSVCSITSLLSEGLNLKRFLYSGALLVVNLGFAYVLNFEKLSFKITSIYAIFLALFCFYLMISGVNPNEVFEHSSRNIFSVLLLEATTLLYIVFIQERNSLDRFPLWPAVLSFVVSVWAIGRSGILSTGFLLCGVIFVNFLKSRRKIRYLFFVSIVVTLVLILFVSWQRESFTLVISRFSTEGLKESHRVGIATHYFRQIAEKPYRLLFGYNVQFDQFLSTVWKSNLHNSYLKLHSIIGIGAIGLLFFIIRGIYKKGKRCTLFWFIGGALLLRAATDTVFLFGPTDFLFFYFLFRDIDCLRRPLMSKQK